MATSRGPSRSPFSPTQSYTKLGPEEALAKFQADDLPDRDEEWHKIVPKEAREALGDREVQRQSVLFEVFKSERDYVHDMELIEEVFANPLRIADPPIIPQDRLQGFLSEVFWNLRDILVHHKRMLGALFARQRDQHPLVQSVADIILDTSLLWRNEYESYIKHYPLAEARHRAELKRSEAYRDFIQRCSQDPRIRKRDLITFLSRPVTRLPRLSLLLGQVHKLTDPDHPDLETLPLLLTILSDFIKSTQPGILAAESKVKFWDLGESLKYQKGEIITRKVGADDGGILQSLRFKMKPMFPFTVYHAASKGSRRYTLFTTSEALRTKWKDALENALAVYHARQEANQSLDDGCFRSPGSQPQYSSGIRFSGKVTNAVPFTSSGKKYIVVACSAGIFVAVRGEAKFTRVLPYSNPTSMLALQDFNKFVVQHEACLYSYSLDLMARVIRHPSSIKSFEATMEKIAGNEGSVLLARSGRVGNRILRMCNISEFQTATHRQTVIFVVKKLLQVTVHTMEAIHPNAQMTPTRHSSHQSFRPFGGPFYIPKDAHDVTPLVKTIAVSTEKGIIIIDPTNVQKSVVTIVPDMSNAANNPPMADLKARCDNARPLGLVRCDADELLVIYDTMGCYITKHGVPSRNCGYIRWEVKVNAFAHRGENVLLFSSEFIEVRNVKNGGRIVQVIEGKDIRLLHAGPAGTNGSGDTILFAQAGKKDDKDGLSDNITEMVETRELSRSSSAVSSRSGSTADNLWDEWDM
ncbi:hypothetical protein HWV62_31305 [Athelia sp. TMB]|nr:hypothetical protein HWV62_31305 [Athelia sp. TMB]